MSSDHQKAKEARIQRYLEEIMSKNRGSLEESIDRESHNLENSGLKEHVEEPISQDRGRRFQNQALESTDAGRQRFQEVHNFQREAEPRMPARQQQRENREIEQVKPYGGLSNNFIQEAPAGDYDSRKARPANIRGGEVAGGDRLKPRAQEQASFDLHDDNDICVSFNNQDRSDKKKHGEERHSGDVEGMGAQRMLSKNTDMHRKPPVNPSYSHQSNRVGPGQSPHDTSLADRESVYQTLVDSVMHSKLQGAGHAPQSGGQSQDTSGLRQGQNGIGSNELPGNYTLEQAMVRFHTLLISPTSPLTAGDQSIISFLFSFYQKYTKTIQTKFADAERKLKQFEVMKRKEEEESRIAKDTDQRHKIAMERIKSLSEENERVASQSRRNEIAAAERLRKLQEECESLAGENAKLRSILDDTDQKQHEYEQQMGEARQKNKSMLVKLEGESKEKEQLRVKLEAFEKKVRDIDEQQIDSMYLRNENDRLRKSAESLIEEVCMYKLKVKELELQVDALREVKEVTKRMVSSPHELDRVLAEKAIQDIAAPARPPLPMRSPQYKELIGATKKPSMVKADAAMLSCDLSESGLSPPTPHTPAQQSSSKYDLFSPSKENEMYQSQKNIKRPPSGTSNVPTVMSQESPANPYALPNAPAKLPPSGKESAFVPLHPSHASPSNPFAIPKPVSNLQSEDSQTQLTRPKRSASHAQSTSSQQHLNLPITSFPSHLKLEQNADVISQLEVELSQQQEKRKLIECQLCKIPYRPKKATEKEKKESLEADLDATTHKISELKKRIKQANKV